MYEYVVINALMFSNSMCRPTCTLCACVCFARVRACVFVRALRVCVRANVRVCSRASGVACVFNYWVNTAPFWLLWESTPTIASYAFLQPTRRIA